MTSNVLTSRIYAHAAPQVNLFTHIATNEPDKYPMAGQTSHEVTVGVYDVATGTTLYLKAGDPKDRYFTNVAWSPDSKTVYIFELLQIAEYIHNNTFKKFGTKEKPFDIFPVTIIADRYGGCASDGKYLAFGCDFWDIPEEIEAADAIADHFWQTTTMTIGRGATPQTALEDLCERREKRRQEQALSSQH